MSKQREKEQKILAQMDEAMRENGGKTQTEEGASAKVSQPQTMHCYRCKSLMEDGVCPICGFKLYVPMSEEKRKKIKTITTVIGFAVFIVAFILLRLV